MFSVLRGRRESEDEVQRLQSGGNRITNCQVLRRGLQQELRSQVDGLDRLQ